MKILAFESSCDETAVAVVEDGRRVLTDQIFSQQICTQCTAVLCQKSHREAMLRSYRCSQSARFRLQVSKKAT